MRHLDLLYRDSDLVAVNKPQDLFVHRTQLAKGVREAALQMLRNQLGQRVFPIHRLDRPTSGVLLFGLTPTATQRLSEQFTERKAHKVYLAITRGFLPETGRIDHPIRHDTNATGKPAVTHFTRLATATVPHPVGKYPEARYSLAQIEPETGRRHQIRKHFAHISHPIIGDTAHGDGRHNRFFRSHFLAHRLFLHAQQLSIEHPVSGETLVIQAPVDHSWQRVCQQLAWPPSLF